MRRFILPALFLFLLAMPMRAAVDLRIQGSIYTEIASEPGDLLRAGTRIQLFSELVPNSAKIRIIGLDQKSGYLNTFDRGSFLRLDNLINWAEVQLNGNIFPQGPSASISIGNVEIDYSPYIISLKDDMLNSYYSSYLNHRGIALRDFNISGFEGAGFILWGFDDFSKNAIGGKLSKKIGHTSFTGIFVDYRYRISDAREKIMDAFARNGQLLSELEWDQTKGIEVEQKIGSLGSLYFFVANQERNDYKRINYQNIEPVQSGSALREYKWKLPITDTVNFLIGYKDIPLGFDPLFRDRTPEFDEKKGYYLGHNPIDRYKDREGFYSEVYAQKDNFKLTLKLEDLKDHQVFPTNFRTADIALAGQVSLYQIDLFSQLKQKSNWLSTGIRNAQEEGFTRLLLTRPVMVGKTPLSAGIEFRRHSDVIGDNNLGTLFMRYQKSDYLVVDAGVRQAFSKNITAGSYWGLNYKAPNGLEFRFRHTYPTVVGDGKYLYDPDYRLREEGNIAQMSVNIIF